MEETLAEIRRLATSICEGTRNKIAGSLRNTFYSIESQDETVDRIMFLVRHRHDFENSSSTNIASAKGQNPDIQSISIFKSPLSAWALILRSLTCYLEVQSH